jgi:hypothetical protein
MSGTDAIANPPTNPQANAQPNPQDEPVTEKIVIPSPPSVPVSRSGAAKSPSRVAAVPFDTTNEPDDWPARGPAKGIRLGWPLAVLLVLLIAGGGIWGGAALQRSQGSSSSTSSIASALASRFGSRGTGGAGGTGARTFGGASTAAATGTVTEVKGSTLYVTNASGNLVEVTLTPSTTVTRNAKTTLSGLAPGDTVVVQGTTSKSGTVTAASVAATAQGVTSGFGGLGG